MTAPTALEELRKVIANLGSIDEEFQRTKQPWPVCLGSKVFCIECYLDNNQVKAALTVEQYVQACRRLDELKETLHALKEQFSEMGALPPETVRNRMLTALDVLKDDDPMI